jgi:hypothetical protein
MAFAGEWDVLGEPNNKVVGPCGVLGGGENARTVVSPSMVNGLVADYDVFNTSGLVVDGSDRVQLVSDSSGNSSENVLVLNGVAGNYASLPDSAALSITGDIDVRAWLAAANYTTTDRQTIFAKYATAGNQRAYWFYIQGSGTGTAKTLVLQISPDGVGVEVFSSSVALPTANFDKVWVRATLDVDDGAGGKIARFYTSADGNVWSQLGADVASAGTTSILDSTANLDIGILNTALGFIGNIYRAQIRNGIDGPIVFDADFTQAAKLATSFTESSVNAATVTINTTGQYGARICGARDLVNMVAANQPIRLPWSGTNYGYLNGVAANYFSTPDSASFPTGDIVLEWWGALSDWTPATAQALVSKDAGGSDRTAVMSIAIGGLPQLYISVDGTATSTATASTLPSATDGQNWGIRAFRAAATGVVTFYQSSDGNNWTQLGTTQSTTSGNLYNSSAELWIGKRVVSSDPVSGRPVRVRVLDGIAGTVLFDFDPTRYTSGTTFTASTGEVWTLNGGSVIVNNSMLYFDGTNDSLKAAAFAYAQPCTVYFLGSQVTWTLNESLFDGGTTGLRHMNLYQAGTTPTVSLNAGNAGAVLANPAVNTRVVLAAVYNAASSSLAVNTGAAATGDAGNRNANGFTLGSNSDPTGFGNITFTRALLYSGAHDEATQRRIIRFLMGQGGVS